jgi:hypothetical protein
MSVKRWQKEDDRPVCAIILKEAVVKYKDRLPLKKEGIQTSTWNYILQENIKLTFAWCFPSNFLYGSIRS